MSKTQAVIFDVDGTLCDVTDIRFHVDHTDPKFTKKNFDAFHTASADCPPHDWVVDAARDAHAKGLIVFVVTARGAQWRVLTQNWLDKHGIPHHALLTRPHNDFRKDRLVKQDILDKIQLHFDVIHAWDDNPAVVQLWRDNNIPVTVVPGWPADNVA